MKTLIASLSFASLLTAASITSAATVSLDFESMTAGSPTVPTGWAYVNSGQGTVAQQNGGSYVTSAANGGSTGAGLGGVLISANSTHGTNIPISFLVNSGSAAGFDVRESLTGSFDFNMAHSAQYDTAGFLFGDIKTGTITGTDAGQLLSIQLANGGFGQANAESRIVDGANVATYAPTTNAGFADGTWYRTSFTWTPTSGLNGDLSYTALRWNGAAWVAHSTFSITGHTFNSPEAYIGIADMWAGSTTFDNLTVTGTLLAAAAAVPEPATAALGLIGLAGLMMRRRRMA